MHDYTLPQWPCHTRERRLLFHGPEAQQPTKVETLETGSVTQQLEASANEGPEALQINTETQQERCFRLLNTHIMSTKSTPDDAEEEPEPKTTFIEEMAATRQESVATPPSQAPTNRENVKDQNQPTDFEKMMNSAIMITPEGRKNLDAEHKQEQPQKVPDAQPKPATAQSDVPVTEKTVEKKQEIKPSLEETYTETFRDAMEVATARVASHKQQAEFTRGELTKTSTLLSGFEWTIKLGGMWKTNRQALKDSSALDEKNATKYGEMAEALRAIETGTGTVQDKLERVQQIRQKMGLPNLPRSVLERQGKNINDAETDKLLHANIDKQEMGRVSEYRKINEALAASEVVLDVWEGVLTTVDTGMTLVVGKVPFGPEVYNLSKTLTAVAMGKDPKEAAFEFALGVAAGHLGGKVLDKTGATKFASQWAEKNSALFTQKAAKALLPTLEKVASKGAERVGKAAGTFVEKKLQDMLVTTVELASGKKTPEEKLEAIATGILGKNAGERFAKSFKGAPQEYVAKLFENRFKISPEDAKSMAGKVWEKVAGNGVSKTIGEGKELDKMFAQLQEKKPETKQQPEPGKQPV